MEVNTFDNITINQPVYVELENSLGQVLKSHFEFIRHHSHIIKKRLLLFSQGSDIKINKLCVSGFQDFSSIDGSTQSAEDLSNFINKSLEIWGRSSSSWRSHSYNTSAMAYLTTFTYLNPKVSFKELLSLLSSVHYYFTSDSIRAQSSKCPLKSLSFSSSLSRNDLISSLIEDDENNMPERVYRTLNSRFKNVNIIDSLTFNFVNVLLYTGFFIDKTHDEALSNVVTIMQNDSMITKNLGHLTKEDRLIVAFLFFGSLIIYKRSKDNLMKRMKRAQISAGEVDFTYSDLAFEAINSALGRFNHAGDIAPYFYGLRTPILRELTDIFSNRSNTGLAHEIIENTEAIINGPQISNPVYTLINKMSFNLSNMFNTDPNSVAREPAMLVLPVNTVKKYISDFIYEIDVDLYNGKIKKIYYILEDDWDYDYKGV